MGDESPSVGDAHVKVEVTKVPLEEREEVAEVLAADRLPSGRNLAQVIAADLLAWRPQPRQLVGRLEQRRAASRSQKVAGEAEAQGQRARAPSLGARGLFIGDDARLEHDEFVRATVDQSQRWRVDRLGRIFPATKPAGELDWVIVIGPAVDDLDRFVALGLARPLVAEGQLDRRERQRKGPGRADQIEDALEQPTVADQLRVALAQIVVEGRDRDPGPILALSRTQVFELPRVQARTGVCIRARLATNAKAEALDCVGGR